MESKRLFRLFTVTDYEEEESFLTEQHKSGWKFVKYTLPGFYTFEKCEPEDMIYRLDFGQTRKGDRETYLQMYRDYGWEYLMEVAGWSYFRKPVSCGEDVEIFSDMESRLALIERVLKHRYLPLIIIFLCCIVSQLCLNTEKWLAGGVFEKGLFAFFVVMAAVYIWLMLHCGRGYRRIKDKYRK